MNFAMQQFAKVVNSGSVKKAYDYAREEGASPAAAMEFSRAVVKLSALDSSFEWGASGCSADVIFCLEEEPEIHDTSYIDTWEKLTPRQKKYQKERIHEIINRDGHWCLVAKVNDEFVESVGDCVGEPLFGYEMEFFLSCVEELEKQRFQSFCHEVQVQGGEL